MGQGHIVTPRRKQEPTKMSLEFSSKFGLVRSTICS